MSLEIKGHVVKILPEVTGQGQNGTWVKQDFLIQTDGEYPKQICFTCWGDKTRDVKNLIEGEEVSVSFNAESREYNDNYYTNLTAWKIKKDLQQAAPPKAPPPPSVPVQQAPPPVSDLPF